MPYLADQFYFFCFILTAVHILFFCNAFRFLETVTEMLFR